MTPTPVLRWLLVAGAALGVLAGTAAASALGPALPALFRDLQMHDPSLLRWISGAFVLAFAAVIVPAAVLGDLVGHARVLMLGAVVFVLASVGGGLAGSGGGLLVARLAQGAGFALLVPQLVGFARARTQGLERALACALFVLAYLVGGALGPVLGAQLTEHTTWRATFWVTLPLVLIAAGAAAPVAFERGFGRLDPPLLVVGFVAIPATLGIAYPLLANDGDWPGSYVGLLVVGCLLLAGCVAVEVYRRGPRAGLGAPLLTLLVFVAAADLTILQLYIQVATGESASMAAMTGLPLAAGALVGAGVAVPVGLRLGLRTTTASGAAVMFLGVAAQLALIKGAPESFGWGAVAFGAGLNGIGLGLVLTALLRTDGRTQPAGSAGLAGPASASPAQAGPASEGVALAGPASANVVPTSPGGVPGPVGVPGGLPGPGGVPGRVADPTPAVLFAAIPLGTAAGVELGQRLISDVADLVVGPGGAEVVERLRDGVASTLLVTAVVLLAAVAVAVFLVPRTDP